MTWIASARFGEVQEEYEHLGGYALESQAREVLHGLGFDDERIDGDVGALGAGKCAWRWHASSSAGLMSCSSTSRRTISTSNRSSGSRRSSNAARRLAHDLPRPGFHELIVNRIAEIDGGEITVYSGNYDFYERERGIREANREAAYARQQAMLAKEQRFIERFAAHAAKAAGPEPRQGARQDRADRAAEEAACRRL